jgi:septum formation protein
MLDNLKMFQIVLASKSPRRKELLSGLGIGFTVQTLDTDESFPNDMNVDEVAEYLAIKKAQPFIASMDQSQLIITADTIVVVDNVVLGKASGYDEAYLMLEQLSGKAHRVLTGIGLFSKTKQVSFTSSSTVYFKKLSHEEIDYYITHFQPFDKAGAYGIQEWIGYIGVEKIEGSYFNVMGLPIQRLYEELRKF